MQQTKVFEDLSVDNHRCTSLSSLLGTCWKLKNICYFTCRVNYTVRILLLHNQNKVQSPKVVTILYVYWFVLIIWLICVIFLPHLQCTVIGPSCPNCSLVLCTCPMKSMKPSPVFGTPCSGQSVNWNWRIVLDWPSWGVAHKGLKYI